MRTLLLTAVLTGMRQGELFGLQWDDIDFARHVIHVQRSLWHGTLRTPKSRRSQRAIDMPPTLEQGLQRLSTTRRSEFVFCSERGTPIDADNFRHREFPGALRRAELRRIRFHDLRHTYTSLLIAHGAHPKYIQAQLGHASIQTTIDRYGLASLANFASRTSGLLLVQPGQSFAGLAHSTSFFRAVPADGRLLRAAARGMIRGRGLAIADIDVYDADGQLAAYAQGVAQLIDSSKRQKQTVSEVKRILATLPFTDIVGCPAPG